MTLGLQLPKVRGADQGSHTIIKSEDIVKRCCINTEIIRRGYGFAYTRFPFRYIDEFRGYEREARENGRGLWKGR